MSYPPRDVVCEDVAIGRMRQRYAAITDELHKVERERERLGTEIADRQRTLLHIAHHVSAARTELDLISAWLRMTDPEYPT